MHVVNSTDINMCFGTQWSTCSPLLKSCFQGLCHKAPLSWLSSAAQCFWSWRC